MVDMSLRNTTRMTTQTQTQSLKTSMRTKIATSLKLCQSQLSKVRPTVREAMAILSQAPILPYVSTTAGTGGIITRGGTVVTDITRSLGASDVTSDTTLSEASVALVDGTGELMLK